MRMKIEQIHKTQKPKKFVQQLDRVRYLVIFGRLWMLDILCSYSLAAEGSQCSKMIIRHKSRRIIVIEKVSVALIISQEPRPKEPFYYCVRNCCNTAERSQTTALLEYKS